MACLSLGWLENFLIGLVIVVAIVMVLRIVVPWAMSAIGIGIDARAATIINIILGAIVLIYLIVIVFGLAGCFLGTGGGTYLPHRP